MKYRILFLSVTAMLVSLSAHSQVDQASLNSFEDGTPAVAAEVNANFQALLDGINSLADRVATLEAASGSNIGSISGSYLLTGVGLDTDCTGDIGNSIAITMHGLSGTAQAADGVLTFTMNEESMAPILRDDGVGNFEVQSRSETEIDSGSISFDSNGVFLDIDGGGFSADGSVFTLSNTDPGCPGNISLVMGVRN